MRLRSSLFVQLLCWAIVLFVSISFTKESETISETLGQPVDGVRDHIEKANQSQAVWFDSTWWGCFRSSGGEDIWHIYKLNRDPLNGSSWSEETSLNMSSEDQVDMHVNPLDLSLIHI